MTDVAGVVDPLPEEVRARVAALAAEALGKLAADQLPVSLRRVASFAPQRRARLAASQINAAIETDEAFRERLAVQVRAAVPEIAHAVEEGQIGGAAPVDVAAVAHLLRPGGWQDVLSRALSALDEERAVRLTAVADEQVEMLREQLAAAAAEVKTARDKARAQVEVLKQENADLRRRLGETRSRLRATESDLEAAATEVTAAGERLAQSESAGQAEVRRLRTTLDAAEAELAGIRRTGRQDRGAATVRARLLLETLLDSAQGLRRELALPTVTGNPADELEADLAPEGTAVPSGTGSLGLDDPALLEQLVSLPRARLIVDGYNVTKTAWPQATLAQQRDRLVAGLGALVARTGVDAIVVFDAAETEQRPLVNSPRGVKVRFSPYGVIADDVIRELVAVEPEGRVVVVVTGDQAVATDVRRSGARVAGAMALAGLVARP